jgi:hypothetical protein
VWIDHDWRGREAVAAERGGTARAGGSAGPDAAARPAGSAR